MDYKKLGAGFVALVLACGISMAALIQEDSNKCSETKGIKKIQEGVFKGDVFTPVNDRAFEMTEDVYVRGIGSFDDPVDIIVTKNRKWKCGETITSNMIIAKKTGVISNMNYINMGKFKPGIYDVFVDEDQDGVYDCGRCNKEIVDSKSFKCFGFEVVPELATAGLLGAGLVSMIGYVRMLRK